MIIVKIYMKNIKIRNFINRNEEICSQEKLSAEEVIYFLVSFFRVYVFVLVF